ncbi:MAG: TerC family protein [Candidatus Competibacteraceae bacterium]|nr:TerC family protein [Candidatus Competibacteraceae bacterium]
MEWLTDPTIWFGLATLIVIEIVLGIDNLVFIAILADKLPPAERDRARVIGLTLALLMRLGLLASLSWLVTLTEPLVTLSGRTFSGRDLILLVGGAFLLFKGTRELHERLESRDHPHGQSQVFAKFWPVVAQIVVLDAVFSLDAVITAVGMVEELAVMMAAVTVAIVLMMVASKPLTRFVNAHRTVIILCLGFLLMIGFSLVAEGFGFHIPKGYLYAAIGFSVLIEAFNQWALYNRRRFLTGKRPFRERTAEAVLRLLGGRVESAEVGEDVAALASAPGGEPLTFDPKERSMIQNVLKLAEQPIPALMTPRPDIVWLDLEASAQEIREVLRQHSYGRYLVCRGDLDEVEGVIQGRDLLVRVLDGESLQLKPALREPLFVHERLNALQVLEQLRQHPIPLAVVMDEYGGVKGLVTAIDILASIAGDLVDTVDVETPKIVREADGIWLLDGGLPLDEVRAMLKFEGLPRGEGYYTLAGLALNQLTRIPEGGEKFVLDPYEFEVANMDERRIHQVRVRRLSQPERPPQPS